MGGAVYVLVLRVIQNFILCILPGTILRYIITAVDRQYFHKEEYK